MDEEHRLGEVADLTSELLGELRAALKAFYAQAAQTDLAAAQALKHLHQIAQQGQHLQIDQQNRLREIERQWPLRLEQAARSSGKEQAQAFADTVAARVKTQLTCATERAREAAAELTTAARTLTFRQTLQICTAVASLCLLAGALMWSITASWEHSLNTLRIQHDQLQSAMKYLTQHHIKLDLRPCAPGDERTCVRVDTLAGGFGLNRDYYVVEDGQ